MSLPTCSSKVQRMKQPRSYFSNGANQTQLVWLVRKWTKSFLIILPRPKNTPIPAAGCDNTACRSSVTKEDILFTIQGFLVLESTWRDLGKALSEAHNGDATIILQQNRLAIGKPFEDSSLFAGMALACQDWSHSASSLSDVQQKQLLTAAISHFTRGASQTYKIQTGCIGWSTSLTNLV
jgi:hypothetical protein